MQNTLVTAVQPIEPDPELLASGSVLESRSERGPILFVSLAQEIRQAELALAPRADQLAGVAAESQLLAFEDAPEASGRLIVQYDLAAGERTALVFKHFREIEQAKAAADSASLRLKTDERNELQHAIAANDPKKYLAKRFAFLDPAQCQVDMLVVRMDHAQEQFATWDKERPLNPENIEYSGGPFTAL